MGKDRVLLTVDNTKDGGLAKSQESLRQFQEEALGDMKKKLEKSNPGLEINVQKVAVLSDDDKAKALATKVQGTLTQLAALTGSSPTGKSLPERLADQNLNTGLPGGSEEISRA